MRTYPAEAPRGPKTTKIRKKSKTHLPSSHPSDIQTIPLQILPIKPPLPQLPLPAIPLLLLLHRPKPQPQPLLHLLLPLPLLFPPLPLLSLSLPLLSLRFTLYFPRCPRRYRGVDLSLARSLVAPICFAGFVSVLALRFEDAAAVVGHGVVVVGVVRVGAG